MRLLLLLKGERGVIIIFIINISVTNIFINVKIYKYWKIFENPEERCIFLYCLFIQSFFFFLESCLKETLEI